MVGQSPTPRARRRCGRQLHCTRAAGWPTPQPLYRVVLAQAPHCFEALHLLGGLRLQRGDAETGAALLRSAIAVDARRAPTHFNLGLALLALGRPEEALASFDAAHRLDPRAAEPENERGRALVALGRYDAALASFDRALTVAPGFLAALNNRGNALRRLGRLEESLAAFDRLLALKPDDPEALNNRGTVLADLGRLEEAIASCGRALELRAGLTVAYLNRGNALIRLKRVNEALGDFDRALALDPNFTDARRSRALALQTLGRLEEALADFDRVLEMDAADAITANNRGALLLALRRPGEALASFDRATRLDPAYALAWSNRGNALRALGRTADALAAYDAAIEAKPGFADALAGRGNVLVMLDRHAEAAESFREAAAAGADPTQIGFALAALGATEVPAAAPAEYVAKLFDQHAETFDHELLEKLKYRTPVYVMEALRTLVPSSTLDVLDVGCGTGLLGPELRKMARSLVGVDLSPKMLERARLRDCYDELVCLELTQYLKRRPEAFDLIVAADVLVYFGDLADVFRHCGLALRPGGLFAFSVEASDRDGFVLRPTRRYAHSLAYLRTMMGSNGLVEVAAENRVIRQEAGVDVAGYIVVARCTRV